ncbi:MAG TPA: hypothetical protein GX506_04930, partial [Firmicutes bacterium]|nr:hypothetical protein [Bacillota bacterium]
MGWAYSVARIRALETRLVDKSKVTRILEADTLEDAIKVLQETEYSAYMSSLHSAEGREEAFSHELARVYRTVGDMVPEDWPVYLLRARYDYHNLKVALKASLTGQEAVPAAFSRLGRVAPEAISEAVKSNSLSDLPTDLRTAAITARAAYEEAGRLSALDGAVDRGMFSYLIDHTPLPGGKFLRGYFARLADIVNIRATVRARAMGLGPGQLGSMLVPGGYIDRDRFVAAYSGPEEGLADAFQ